LSEKTFIDLSSCSRKQLSPLIVPAGEVK
jgi:hypothetical protein